MEKIRRITAMATVVVIIGLIVGTIICALTGSPYFWGMFFLMIIVPVVLWVFMWFTRLVSGVDDNAEMSPDNSSDDIMNKEEM